MILHGDCLIRMKELADNSVDAIVTDPPYGLSFMGKKWDYDVPSTEIWREALRVLKPGGHLLAFFGTRTYHRGVVRIEDAGFEIRDQLAWLYGQGFPKSHNIKEGDFKGWGTALKPANEPICLARKPLEKGLTVAENVLKWGVGGLNIDVSRIGLADGERTPSGSGNSSQGAVAGWGNGGKGSVTPALGRWPANVLFDEEAAKLLDEQSIAGGIHSAGKARPRQKHIGDFGIAEHGSRERMADHRYGDDKIGASRFFYVAKASKRERGEGNVHPTVKPVKLMEYLIKLVTPPNGTVLDPFMGSGSTGVACKNLGFKFIGIEMNEEYVKIAERRIAA